MKYGTQLVEDGRGETTAILWQAMIGYSWSAIPKAKANLAGIYIAYSHGKRRSMRTNLKLTGQPLTSEDVSAIAHCN